MRISEIVNGQVAASTQNQAFNALLFLYGKVVHQPLENVQASAIVGSKATQAISSAGIVVVVT